LSRMAFRLVTSAADGLKKIAVASAYMETLNLVVLPLSLLSRPCPWLPVGASEVGQWLE
jgi:hypothetical protein